VCSIFGKSCVWISRSCFGSVNSSILACDKKARYAEQSRFFSHKETIHARIGDVNRDLAEQSKCFTGGTPSDGAKLLPSQIAPSAS
jgi:hypothetical protein